MIHWLLLILAALALPLMADAIDEERRWTGKNGHSFRGIFIRVLDGGAKAEIASNSGKVFTIDIDNLVAGDRLLIRSAMAAEQEKKEEKKKDPEAKKEEADIEGFRKPPVTPRQTVLVVTPKAVGSRESDELLDPLWQFVGWWDARGILPIPKKGDEEKRLEWAHERLARYCNTRNGSSVIRPEEAKEGLEKYFLEHHADEAAVAVHIDTDFSPAMLQRYCEGINAVVLGMTMQYGNQSRTYRACAAVESIDANGNAVLHLWGQRKNARLVLDEQRPAGRMFGRRRLSLANDSYKVVLADLDGLPDHIVAKGPSFKVDPERNDTVLIAKPYLYEQAGQRRRLPKDPLFEPRIDRPGQVPQKVEALQVDLPLDFSSKPDTEREWNFADGSTFKGSLSFDAERKGVLRDRRGQTKELEVESLTPEDQASYYFAYGCYGHGAAPPRLELEYRLRSQNGGSYDFVISTQGSLGRVDCKQTNRTLIFDLEDNAYHCWAGSYRYHGRWSELHRGSPGLVPVLVRPGNDEAEQRESFSETVTLARKATDFPYPSRRAQFPLDGETFKRPKVDFTVMQDITATVAIYQTLYTSSPASYDPAEPKDPLRSSVIVFSNAREVGCHRGIRDIAHRFTSHHLLPLKMSWSNDVNTSWVERSDQIKTSGQFELALTAARVPASFPDDHFPIPEAARKAEIGTCIKPAK